MQINTAITNNIFIDNNKNITITGIENTQNTSKSNEEENQSIAVKMKISQKGRELSKQHKLKENPFDGELIKEDKIVVKKNVDEDISAKIDAARMKIDDLASKKGTITEEGKEILEEIEKQKEKDYSEFVVQKNIIDEMQNNTTQAVMEADQKQNDVEIMIRSLGEESGWTYEKKQDEASINNMTGYAMRDGSLFGDLTSPESAVDFSGRQSVHIKKEAFEADQSIQDTIALSEKRLEQYKENILGYQKEIIRIVDEDREVMEKCLLSKEDYMSYKEGKKKELSGFYKLIADEKEGMYEEIRTLNAINKANVGNQNMAGASNKAKQLTDAANDEFMKRTMNEALKKVSGEYELKFDVNKKHEADKEIENNNREEEAGC